MTAATEIRWQREAEAQLKGRRIVGVRYMTFKEMRDLEWGHRPLVITLDDGNMIFPACDDEGNGPGAIFTNHAHVNVLPII